MFSPSEDPGERSSHKGGREGQKGQSPFTGHWEAKEARHKRPHGVMSPLNRKSMVPGCQVLQARGNGRVIVCVCVGGDSRCFRWRWRLMSNTGRVLNTTDVCTLKW